MPQSIDRNHQTLVLQEFTEVDQTLSKYLGPTHPVRKELSRLMEDLKRRLLT